MSMNRKPASVCPELTVYLAELKSVCAHNSRVYMQETDAWRNSASSAVSVQMDKQGFELGPFFKQEGFISVHKCCLTR